MAIMLREVHTCLDLSGDLSYASLAERLEQVRVMLRQRKTLITTNAGPERPVLYFFVVAPLTRRNWFIYTRWAYIQVLDRALAWQPERVDDVAALLRVRRALDEEITRRLENHMEDGKVLPPMGRDEETEAKAEAVYDPPEEGQAGRSRLARW